jgi:hypothetical protein
LSSFSIVFRADLFNEAGQLMPFHPVEEEVPEPQEAEKAGL